MFLLSPFVAAFGSLFLVFLLAMNFLPVVALICIFTGQYFYCAGIVVLWFVWRRFRKRVQSLVNEGWEYAGL